MGFWKWLASSIIKRITARTVVAGIMWLGLMMLYLYLVKDILLEALGVIAFSMGWILYNAYEYYKEFVAQAR